MAIGLVIIEKELNGETWTNTHAFGTGGDTALTSEDMDAIGVPEVQAGGLPALGGAGYDPATGKFLSALLAFERYLTFSPINYTRVYVTDGKINNIADPNAFAVATLGVTGGRSLAADSPDTIMPGNVTLQINRVPASYSVRQGRMYMRGVLTDSAVKFAGRGGVAYTDNSTADVYRTLLQTALAGSGLPRFFGAGSTTVFYAIPRYVTEPLLGVQREGQLDSVNAIGSLVVLGPVSRQMKRGKKRKAA